MLHLPGRFAVAGRTFQPAAIVALAAALILQFAATAFLAGVAMAGTCAERSVGVDPALGDTAMYAYYCRGVSQTFLAADTLIRSLTVWSPPRSYEEMNAYRLFIVGTTDGVLDPRIQLAPEQRLIVTTADPLHPIPYTWTFDPPLALPDSGEYGFVILGFDDDVLPVLSTSHDPYALGSEYNTDPVADCSVPGSVRNYESSSWDACFKIVFCMDQPVAVSKRTWGMLKTLYR